MSRSDDIFMKEALFFKREGEFVKCELCPHGCVIAEGDTGKCGQGRNREGSLTAGG